MLRLGFALALCSCATTATLTTPRGTVEATLLGGDDDSLLVVTEAGSKRRVPREEVRDIDHPGNVLATVFGTSGAVFALETVAFATTGTCATSSGGGGTGVLPCALTGGLTIVSIGFFAWGLWTWLSSRNAVFNPPPAPDGDLSKFPLAFPKADRPLRAPPGVPPPL